MLKTYGNLKSNRSAGEMPKKAVQHASKTLKNIRSVYVQDKSATVSGGEVDEFRVNLNSLLK